MIELTRAEKLADLSIKMLTPWKSHQSPRCNAAKTISYPVLMAIGLILFLVVIWFLPSTDD